MVKLARNGPKFSLLKLLKNSVKIYLEIWSNIAQKTQSTTTHKFVQITSKKLSQIVEKHTQSMFVNMKLTYLVNLKNILP